MKQEAELQIGYEVLSSFFFFLLFDPDLNISTHSASFKFQTASEVLSADTDIVAFVIRYNTTE